VKKIIIQEKVINFLFNSFRENRISHAYIFLGPEGVGKSFTAKYFAQILNCTNKENPPCFECSNCIKIENDNHPDVHWIRPEEGSQGIKIETIRELQEKISLKPYEAKFKVFIIEKADSLLEDASNCLLKTLEEPPGESVLILLAEEIEKFLPTIVSRCQIVRFSLLKKKMIENFLRENYSLDEEKISFYSKFAEGSLGRAISFVESDFLEKRNFILEKILEKKEFDNDLWWKEKEVFLEILNILSGIFRDALFKKLSLDELILNIDQRDLISQIAFSHSLEELYNFIEKINFYYNLIQQNVNLRLIFTNLEMDLDYRKDKKC